MLHARISRLLTIVAVVAGLVQPLVSASPAHADNPTTPPFTECPAVGADSSCGMLIVINSDGTTTVNSDPSQGPYDSVEDTLIGIVNNSSRPVGALALHSSTDLFNFEGDGLCAMTPVLAGCPFGPTGYEGPGVSFSDVSSDSSSGVVDFAGGLPPGGTSYFSLEESLTTATVQVGTGQAPIGTGEQGGPTNRREHHTTCPVGQPINCATGVFWHTFSDLTIAGRGLGVDVSRTYDSARAGSDGPFGHGWTGSYWMSLAVDSVGNVTVNEENGATISFTAAANGTYSAPDRVLATLTHNADGTYTLTDSRTRATYTFTGAGALVAEADRNGNTTTLSYTNGRLSGATDPAGRTVTVATDTNGHISSVTDPANRTVRYTYDASGNLTSATDPTGAVTSFTYDQNHQMLTMTDGRGDTVTNVYDANGRVTSQTDGAGRTTSLAYTGDPTSDAGGTTTITDPNGNVTAHQYADLELSTVTRAAGTPAAATWSYSYDPFTLGVASVTDPNGHTHSYTYDRRGNLLTATDPLGHTTSYTYNALNEPTAITDPLGNTTSYGYDTAGNVLTVTRPLTSTSTATTSYGYDPNHPGDLTSVTDPNNHTTSYGYDTAGDLTAVTDPNNHTTSYGYDTVSELTSITSARGYTTHYNLDGDGRVTGVTDPDGHTTSTQYDAAGNPTSATDANGRTTSVTYNGDNQPTAVTYPGGAAVGYTYDADGNRTSYVDGVGQTWTDSYDPLNRLSSATDPLRHTTHYTYDGAGNLLTTKNANAVTATNSYDAADELTRTSYDDATTPTVTYTYDADGRRTHMTDGTGTSSYNYDVTGRIHSTIDGAGATVTYTYDPAGNRIAINYPSGGPYVSYSYDAANQMNTVGDGHNNWSHFAYDADGNLTTTSYANGVVSTTAYDKNDRPTTITDAKGTGTLASFGYNRDNNGQITATTTTLPATVTGTSSSYTYTPRDQLAAETDNPGGTLWYFYNDAGYLTDASNVGIMDYNPAGEIVTRHPNSVTKDTYTYNNDGDRISETDAAAPTTPLTYDANDRLTSYNSAATYTYNGDGLRTSKTIAAVTTRFSYDLTTPAPQLLADNTGYYIYGPNGEVVEQLDHNAAALYLHQDQLGSTRLITGATGESVGSLTYTPYGTPTGAATSAASTLTPIGFAGAYTDTETGYLYLTNRYYDPTTGQFLTRDPLQATTAQPYQYANDDPLDFTDPSGLCWGPAWACTAASAAGGAIGGAASWTNQNVVQPIYHDVVLPVYHHSGDIATGLAVGACLTASLADAETTGGVCIAGGIAAFGARVNQRRMESGWCGSWQEDLADLVLAAGTLGIGGAAESALAEWAPETPLYELVKTGLKIRLAVPEVLIEVIDHLGH